jgi:hypothetical protein
MEFAQQSGSFADCGGVFHFNEFPGVDVVNEAVDGMISAPGSLMIT